MRIYRKNLSTLEYFREVFLPEQFPNKNIDEFFADIPVPDIMDDAAQMDALSRVIRELHDGDSLTIDLTGGFRNTAALLVTMARYISGIVKLKDCKIWYTDYPKVYDSTVLYDLMDLISATDHFFTTGRVDLLTAFCNKTFLKEKPDHPVRELLTALTQFSDHLMLCQIGTVDNDINAICLALENYHTEENSNTTEEMLFGLLHEEFKKRFEPFMTKESRIDPLPALVKWCMESQLYQQALTLLFERMPRYVIERESLRITPRGLDDFRRFADNKKSNVRKEYWYFPIYRHFIFDAQCYGNKAQMEFIDRGEEEIKIITEKAGKAFLDNNIKCKRFECTNGSYETLLKSFSLYSEAIWYRHHINHASTASSSISVKYVSDFLKTVYDFLHDLEEKPCVGAGEKNLTLKI